MNDLQAVALAWRGFVRTPELDETPLSPAEMWVAVRECILPFSTPNPERAHREN